MAFRGWPATTPCGASAMRHNSAAIGFVSRPVILEAAKRLGLAEGQMLVAGSEEEMTLAFDLALHAAKQARSRALDRYARATPPPGSDEARALDAMRHARFSIWRVERRHETAGLVVADRLRETEQGLVDEKLEASARRTWRLPGAPANPTASR